MRATCSPEYTVWLCSKNVPPPSNSLLCENDKIERVGLRVRVVHLCCAIMQALEGLGRKNFPVFRNENTRLFTQSTLTQSTLTQSTTKRHQLQKNGNTYLHTGFSRTLKDSTEPSLHTNTAHAGAHQPLQ